MKQTYLLILSLFVCASLVTAQKKDAAQAEFDELRYQEAIRLSLRQDTNKAVVAGRLANAYRLTKKYEESLHWYRKFLRIGTPAATDYFNAASVFSNNGWYDSAQVAYQQYLKLQTGTPVEIDYAAIKGLMTDSTGTDIFYLSLNTNYDEFCAVPFKDGLIFTSNRTPGNYAHRSFAWDNKPFTDLWYVKSRDMIRKIPVDSNLYKLLYAQRRKLSSHDTPPTSNDSKTIGNYALPFFKDTTKKNRPELLSSKLNSKYHDGPATVNAANTLIAFTSNNHENTDYALDGINKLMIYTSRYENGNWSDKKAFQYNGNDFSTGHPSFNAAGDTMYFASNKPGGYGGSDIYLTAWDGKAWTQPRNLGPLVNTASDEKFPYISHTGILYFSSEGHTGLGGLDIFKIPTLKGLPTGICKNLGFPFNSNKDDFGITIDAAEQSGYFSSNRLFSDDIFIFQKRAQ